MNTSNSNLTFKGNPLRVSGQAVRVGDTAPIFKLVTVDMQDATNETYSGKVLIISAIPSIDTPICQIETKRFNEEAGKLPGNVVVLTVSLDLPFAQKRWCGAEGVNKVVMLSDYKYRTFGEAYGAFLPDLGLLARAIFVVDTSGKVQHVEYVPEIGQEPDYNAVLNAAKNCR